MIRIEIRKPNETELKQIIALSPQALFEGTLGDVKPTDEKIKQLIDPLLKKGCFYLIVAEENQLMGWVLLGASKDQFTDKMVGFIYELFVREEFRGMGISKQLLSSAVDHLKMEGYPEVRLSAFAKNPAIKLYEKMGFNIRNVTMNLKL